MTTPPGSPYPYGPLGLIWWLPGRLMEILGALGMMAVLAHQRAWLTLAIVAAWPFMIYMTTSGINDYSAAGVLVGSLVLMRTHPRLGMAGLAVAVALKPYAIAWAVSAIGFAGGAAFAMFAGVSLLLWAPVLLWWGPSSYLASVLAAEALHERVAAINAGGGSINFPEGRWIAVPIALAGRRFSSWRAMVLLGSGAFAAFLFLSPWTSGGYWVVLLPVVGLALEATRQGRAGQAPGSVLATADGGGPKQPPWWADLPWEPHGNSRKATTPPRPA